MREPSYKQISVSGLCLWLGADGVWGHGHCWPWQCWGELTLVGCEGFSNLSSSMIPYHFAALVSTLGVACAALAFCTGVCQQPPLLPVSSLSVPCAPITLVFLLFHPAVDF